MRKIAQASVHQNTDLPTIEDLLVPEISKNVQKNITLAIKESYELKREAKRLLYIAKRGVEIAIEQGEEEAQSWVSQEAKRHSLTIL